MSGSRTSELSGFYQKSRSERLDAVQAFAQLTAAQRILLEKECALDFATANRMIENVITAFPLPLGVATNFRINEKDYLIPMVLEEPSVIAAASFVAKLARTNGGFTASARPPLMIGQIQLVNVPSITKAIKKISAEKKALIKHANEHDPAVLVKYGGGLKDLELRNIKTSRGRMLIVHLLVDCRDAMGANAVNTLCESLAPKLEQLSGGEARLRIISNYAVHRTATATAVWSKESLAQSVKGMNISGEEIVERILDAHAFAAADVYRAATHNKGIMNGIDAAVIATGNDFRAIEAGAHAFAARTGKYRPLTTYTTNKNGDLVGKIELPVALGIIGGAIRTHPLAQVSLNILGVQSAQELAMVLASLGLAQNFAALRALATEGIQKGHMKLHAANIAVMAGAQDKEIDVITQKLCAEKTITVSRAQELLKELRAGR